MAQRLVTRHGLTEGELAAASELALRCNRHEALDLPTRLDWLRAQTGSEAPQFLYYGADGLIGFASLEEGQEFELWGMVDPEHRRQGIGRVLLAAATRVCRGRGSLLLWSDAVSGSGKAFATAVGGQYTFSEYEMVWRGDPGALGSLPAALRLRWAGQTQIEALVSITAAAFGYTERQVWPEVAAMLQELQRRFYIAELDGSAIGSLSVVGRDERLYITTFGVRPEHQGRGYGRAMLVQIVRRLLAEGHRDIRIEVASQNHQALALYRSCGFHEIRTHDYYRLDL